MVTVSENACPSRKWVFELVGGIICVSVTPSTLRDMLSGQEMCPVLSPLMSCQLNLYYVQLRPEE